MAKHCEDCGTQMRGGVCPYCCEELYIHRFQDDYVEAEQSATFIAKVREQEQQVAKLKAGGR